MKALIIAAGQGSRLNELTAKKPKALMSVLGLSLIERIILTTKRAGINEFVIVVGYLGEKIRSFLADGTKLNVKIDYIENDEWYKGNGVSVLKAKHVLHDNFILLMSDHIFDGRILPELIDYGINGSVVLAVDSNAPSEEETRVLGNNGKIVDIGKDIKDSNYVDTGIFLCSPKIFHYIEIAVKEDKTELSDGVHEAAKNGDAEIFDIDQINKYASKLRKDIKPWWIDIDTKENLIKAKEIIIEDASKNPSDALAYYVHKPIENKLVSFLSNFNITPNQLTIIVNMIAYTATALFLLGYLLPASILTFVVGIADGLDGKLARVKLKTSKVGSLEHSFDLLFEFSWFMALSWYLFRSTRSSIPLVLCLFIILFISFYRHVYDQFRGTADRSLDDAGDFERIFKKVAGRRNLYNIPILVSILLGVPLYSLIFILFHSGITAAVYCSRSIKHLYILDQEKTI
jgi:CDP-L-myo-inositol myo-inositolphosphotransferase